MRKLSIGFEIFRKEKTSSYLSILRRRSVLTKILLASVSEPDPESLWNFSLLLFGECFVEIDRLLPLSTTRLIVMRIPVGAS